MQVPLAAPATALPMSAPFRVVPKAAPQNQGPNDNLWNWQQQFVEARAGSFNRDANAVAFAAAYSMRRCGYQ